MMFEIFRIRNFRGFFCVFLLDAGPACQPRFSGLNWQPIKAVLVLYRSVSTRAYPTRYIGFDDELYFALKGA